MKKEERRIMNNEEGRRRTKRRKTDEGQIIGILVLLRVTAYNIRVHYMLLLDTTMVLLFYYAFATLLLLRFFFLLVTTFCCNLHVLLLFTRAWHGRQRRYCRQRRQSRQRRIGSSRGSRKMQEKRRNQRGSIVGAIEGTSRNNCRNMQGKVGKGVNKVGIRQGNCKTQVGTGVDIYEKGRNMYGPLHSPISSTTRLPMKQNLYFFRRSKRCFIYPTFSTRLGGPQWSSRAPGKE